MDIQPPKSLCRPLSIPNKLLLGAGPSNCSARVLQAMNRPILGPVHPELFQLMDEIKQGIQYIFQTKNPLTLAIVGSGHSGIEAIMCNLLEDGDKVVVARKGFWGSRAAIIAERYGAATIVIDAELGNNFDLNRIEKAIAFHKPLLFFIVHGESSTGILQNLEGIGDICRKYNCLLVVDAVASVCCVPLFMDRWGIDAIFAGSQKALSAPPGIAAISFSKRAQDRIFKRKSSVKVFFWDMKMLSDYWNCFDNPRIYHHTISSSLLYGFREALALISEETLETSIKRHEKCAKRLYEGLERLGLELFVNDADKRLPNITTVKVPKNLDNIEIAKYIMQRFNVEIGQGICPTSHKILRIGLMGNNATVENVNYVLKAVEEAISDLNSNQNCSKL